MYVGHVYRQLDFVTNAVLHSQVQDDPFKSQYEREGLSLFRLHTKIA